MIEANRLSRPGERAALERVEAIVERIDDMPVERLVPSLHSLPLPAAHARMVAELEAEADRCGRRELLDDVRDRVRDAIHVRLYGQLNRLPTSAAGYAILPVRVDDAAAVEMTMVDAVAVALMEDRLTSETAARLSAPGRALLGLPSLGEPVLAGSPAPLIDEPSPEDWAEAAAGAASPALRIEEPSPEDWAEAAIGDAQTGDYAPIPVGVRVGLAVVAACTIGPAALFIGVAGGSTLVGIAAGLAVVALSWLVATYRR